MKNLLFLYFFLIFNLDLNASFFTNFTKNVKNFFKSDYTEEEEEFIDIFKENIDINSHTPSKFYLMQDSDKNKIIQKLYNLKNKNDKSYQIIIKYIKDSSSNDYDTVIKGIKKIEKENNQMKLQEDLIEKNKIIQKPEIEEKGNENNINQEYDDKPIELISKPKISIPLIKKKNKKEKKQEMKQEKQETINYYKEIIDKNEKEKKEEKKEKEKEFATVLSGIIGNDVEKIYSETGKDKFDKRKLLETIIKSPNVKEKFDKMSPEKKEQFKKTLLGVIEKKKESLDKGEWINNDLHKKYKINESKGFKNNDFDYSNLLKTFDKELESEFKKEEQFEKNQQLKPDFSEKEIEFIEKTIQERFLIQRKNSKNQLNKKSNFFKKHEKILKKLIANNKNKKK